MKCGELDVAPCVTPCIRTPPRPSCTHARTCVCLWVRLLPQRRPSARGTGQQAGGGGRPEPRRVSEHQLSKRFIQGAGAGHPCRPAGMFHPTAKPAERSSPSAQACRHIGRERRRLAHIITMADAGSGYHAQDGCRSHHAPCTMGASAEAGTQQGQPCPQSPSTSLIPARTCMCAPKCHATAPKLHPASAFHPATQVLPQTNRWMGPLKLKTRGQPSPISPAIKKAGRLGTPLGVAS